MGKISLNELNQSNVLKDVLIGVIYYNQDDNSHCKTTSHKTINQPTVELRKIKSHENHKKPQIHVLEFLWKNKVQAIRFQTVKSQNPILRVRENLFRW